MRRAAILCCSLLTLAGCATATKTYAPDGREAFSIDCSGPDLNWGSCNVKAGEICKEKGYDIISREGEQGESIVGYANKQSAGIYGNSLHCRTMTIACKK